MRRPKLIWAGVVLAVWFVFGCAGKQPSLPAPSSPTENSGPAKASDSLPSQEVTAPVAEPVVLTPDSLGPQPRPFVVVENNNFKSVRTRLIPRVMGRGWTLSVNKSDSIEFLRNADAAVTAFLFHCPPVPAARIRLRFRLQQVKDGVKIVSTAHLVGTSVYPYRPVLKVLEDNLAELRTDLMNSPSTLDPLEPVPTKKKK